MAKKKVKKAKKAAQKPKSVIETEEIIAGEAEVIDEVIIEGATPIDVPKAVLPVEEAKPEIEQCPNCLRMVKAKRIFRCPKCGKNGCDRCGWDALTIKNCPSCAVEIRG